MADKSGLVVVVVDEEGDVVDVVDGNVAKEVVAILRKLGVRGWRVTTADVIDLKSFAEMCEDEFGEDPEAGEDDDEEEDEEEEDP